MKLATTLILLLMSVSLHATAQEVEELETRDFLLTSADIGLGRLISERWGLLRATIRNDSGDDRTYMVIVEPKVATDITFGRRIWVPAGSQRRAWVPYRPGELDPEARSIEVIGKAFQVVDGDERIVASQPSAINARPDDHRSAIVSSDDRAVSDVTWRLFQAARLASNKTQTVSPLRPDRFPENILGLDAADSILVARKSLDLSMTQREALRQWVAEGGHLWVMLDVCDEQTLADVLGDVWTFHVVDRQSVNHLHLSGADVDLKASYEDPVDTVRVLAEDAQTLLEANGWPAALRKKVGRGEVIVTTVGAKAWFDEQSKAVNAAMEVVSRPLFADRFYRDIAPSLIEDYVQEQIGYEVASKSMVGGVLLLFAVVLLVNGLLLARAGRLEAMGLVSVGGAVIAMIVVLLIGAASRRGVPPTMSYGQFVQVMPELNVALKSGLAYLYSPSRSDANIPATADTLIVPKLDNEAGVRMIWTGADRYEWQNLPLRGGAARRLEFRGGVHLPQTASALVRLEADGVSFEVDSGRLGQMTDVVLASGRRAVPAVKTGEQRFRVSRDALDDSQGEYIRGTTLTSKQRRRQGIYERIFTTGSYFQHPVALGWAPNLTSGVGHPFIDEVVGDNLVGIRVRLHRPADRQSLTVPSMFMHREVFNFGPSGKRTTIYDRAEDQWFPTPQPLHLRLRYTVPTDLQPATVAAARLALNIDAVGYRVSVGVVDAGGKVTSVRQLNEPRGVQQIVFKELPAGLRDEINISLRVMPTQRQAQVLSNWLISAVDLECDIELLPRLDER